MKTMEIGYCFQPDAKWSSPRTSRLTGQANLSTQKPPRPFHGTQRPQRILGKNANQNAVGCAIWDLEGAVAPSLNLHLVAQALQGRRALMDDRAVLRSFFFQFAFWLSACASCNLRSSRQRAYCSALAGSGSS